MSVSSGPEAAGSYGTLAQPTAGPDGTLTLCCSFVAFSFGTELAGTASHHQSESGSTEIAGLEQASSPGRSAARVGGHPSLTGGIQG